MKAESESQFTRVEQPSDVKAGDKLVWEAYQNSDSSALYWATVSKVTPKSIIVDVPDAGSKQRSQTFRMRSIYGGHSPEVLEPWGDASGGLYKPVGNKAQEIVQAAYDHRTAAAAAKKAQKDAQEQERQERIAQERAEAAAANPNVTFTQFSAIGNDMYYHGFVLDHNGQINLVVLAVRHTKNDSWKDEERDAHPMIWKCATNYTTASRSADYGPYTMNGASDISANTLELLFQEVIYRIW